MASVSENVENVLRIPPLSPSRRDYSLRSCSANVSDSDTSRPQSPWRPRDSQLPSREVSTYQLCEASPPALGRSTYYSGPLPVLSNEVDMSGNRMRYSGPTPPPSFFSGPLTGFSSSTINTFGFLPRARSTDRQLSDATFSEVPEVGSSRGSTSAEDVEEELAPVDVDDNVSEFVDNATHRLRGSCAPPRISSRMKTHMPNRACFSHELEVGYEVAQQRPRVERAFKSGELEALRSCAGGIHSSSSGVLNGELLRVAEVVDAREHRMSWNALNKDNRPRCEMAAIAIPFKWDDAPGKARHALRKSHSPASSNSTQSHICEEKLKDSHNSAPNESSFENSHRMHGGIRKGPGKFESERRSEDLDTSRNANVAPAASSIVDSSTPSAKPAPQKAVRSSVPFKWEEEPGKPKFEEKIALDPAPTLQLPPRLVSAAVKCNSFSKPTISSRSRSMSIISGNQVRPVKRNASEPQSRESSVGKHSHRSQEEAPSPQSYSSLQLSPQNGNHCHTHSTNFLSGPLDHTARPSRASSKGSLASKSGPITQSGSPQCQNAEFLCAASARSPTSTLCGPGSAPSSCSRESTRTSLSAPCSHSSSGTSVELFEHWSYEDQASPLSTSRNPSKDFESQGSSRSASVRSHDNVKTHNVCDVPNRNPRILQSKMSKPPVHSSHSAAAASSRTVNVNEYSSHEEEFWSSQSSPSRPPSKPEDEFSSTAKEDVIELEPPTRLPYKMPSPRTPDPVVKSEPHSSTRTVSEHPACFPRFFSKGEPGSKTTPCFWVENPSFHAQASYKEDGQKSPAYKATLELLSPSPESSKKSPSRQSKVAKLALSSSRRWHMHFSSLKSMLQRRS
ncbi:uncharacterized protein [Physcomitrium patens]|uniref:Uncharacterized protein n=1 Tax=Physcomitrium patens TaxID=3218 RepID=A0A2K1IFE0_PHYPA|nr:uncharacterized protein LOC112276387 [Physcomitrium patens]PNR27992.1 hypothetical protein PHYPA_028584 [Physcomitrium patens]|eukprot:XP_024363431.1 uncharacterized protein LOC112276387 [Physcomitrella patens]